MPTPSEEPKRVPPVSQPRSSPRRWITLGLCLVVATGVSWAATEYFLRHGIARIPTELVGKWVVTGGEQDGATFDFYRNGDMLGRINVAGNEGILNARVAVDGATLLITTRNPHTKRDETRKNTIKTLTETELVLQDERNQMFRMRRAEK